MVTCPLPNILDFEASGFGSSSYPIEVGYCLSSGERFCALISPHDNWLHWSDEAEALHGISRKLLRETGRGVVSICQELNRRLQGAVLYSDGWVVDSAWLSRLYQMSGIAPSFTLSAIEHIQSEGQHNIWDDVRAEMLRQDSCSRHRASSDAEFIQRLYAKTRNMAL